MKSKLIITIEVEEDFSDTELLVNKLHELDELKVSDVFNPNAGIIVKSIGRIDGQQPTNTNDSSLKPSRIDLMMITRR